MMTDRMTYRWLWSCLIAGGLLLLTGCADSLEEESQPSPEPQPEEGSKLELQAVTRTDGAESYTGNQNICIFLTTPTDCEPGEFEYSATGWNTDLSVKEERQYYIYGYMPSDLTCETPTKPDGGDYSTGINFKLSSMPAITLDDISVIVGVQRVTKQTEDPDKPKVTMGNYGYRSGIKGQNFVNLLMAHLYSGLALKFKIGEEYAKLRSIRLKTVTLNCSYSMVDAIVNIRKGLGLGSPSFEKTSSSSSLQTAVMLNEEKVLDTTTDEITTNVAYCAPILADGTTLTITSEYDVYDKKVKIDSRVSSNKVQISKSDLKPGQKNTITLTVKPTYLYILSDNDFDIKVN